MAFEPARLFENVMKIIVITQNLFRINEALEKSSHDVIGIIEAAERDYTAPSRLFRLLRSVYTVFKSITGNKTQSTRHYCKNRGIPYALLTGTNNTEIAKWVCDLSPDLLVVFSMSQLLKESIFSIPKYGTINLHPSWLPDYRGPNPDFWQYYHMETCPGATVHWINKGEDTGDIIFQERGEMPLGTKSPEWLDMVINRTGAPLLVRAIDAIEQQQAPRLQQPHTSPTPRARIVLPEEHSTIIDWEYWPIERIWHVMRGTESWLNCIDGPTGLMRGQRWEVGELQYENSQEHSIWGSVQHDNQGFYIVCRGGKIRLHVRFRLAPLIKSFL